MGTPQPADGQYIQQSPSTTLLLRRLTIRCPVTGRAADTGFEISAMPSATRPPHLLVDCLECGQDHEWTVDDVYVDPR
jgi:hypothetical protein